MKYYEIALPIRVEKLYVYKTEEDIRQGCRVLVSLQNSFHTGIVWQETAKLDKNLKYKEILEIIDESPKISHNQLQLAKWISNYYQCGLGQTLSAMLPSGFNVQLQQQIKKIADKPTLDSDGTPELILNQLSKLNWLNIPDLKKKLNIKAAVFNSWLEKLENQNIIEIKRVYDTRIKIKLANFLILNRVEEIPQLTEKQKAAWELIKQKGVEFPLKEIVDKVSRSVLKALENKGILRIEPREVKEEYFVVPSEQKPKKLKLTDEQEQAVNKINNSIQNGDFQSFLLYGITGSGKTEVYIRVIKKCLEKEKTALMLVPEISLTPQMVERFYNAFGQDIAILHSHLNERQRWQQWNKIKSGKSKIVIGARSAIFAPLENIGIIIVDEEHENTYKQDKTPRYNGRDIAIVRARLSNAVVILGSATPSLESWQNVENGKSILLQLTKRPLTYKLPSVQIIDLKKEEDPNAHFSATLKIRIEKKLAAGEQIILFHNRRGHSSFVQCVSCGKLFQCPHCEISMNFHSSSQELICHYCGHKIDLPRKCPECGSFMFSFGAPGTQQIEKELQILFPSARILRMDSDSTRRKDSYDSMFERMKKGNIDILLGTQMIAKGLDFANVTLVGVISADIGLNIPDFRAAERTFQLLTQVAGRSGRGEKPGEVIIQTYNPEHYAITCATRQDFVSFSEQELKLRKLLKYPPTYRLARFLFSHKNEKYLRTQLIKNDHIIERLKKLFKPENLFVLGPVQAPFIKMKNNYRYHIILKADSVQTLSQSVNYLKENLKLGSMVRMIIDIDPYSLL
jgi:primosomal protein N' (replication factor Y)